MPINARDDLYECRFPRAVFAEQHMHFTAPHIKIDAIKSKGAGELLGNFFKLENYVPGVRCLRGRRIVNY